MNKILDRKILILIVFLVMCSTSFSAVTGAKYFSQFITVLEDFFSDSKKVLVAIAMVIFAVKGVQAVAGSDSQGFIVTLFNILFIVAIVGVVITVLVAVGGATIDENYLITNGLETVKKTNSYGFMITPFYILGMIGVLVTMIMSNYRHNKKNIEVFNYEIG